MSTSTNQQRKELGQALWLLAFLRINRRKVTRRIITYRWISEQTGGIPPRTLRKWMQRLKKLGYVEVQRHTWGIEVRIREL